MKVPPNSKLIQLLLKIYQDTYDQKITDAYYASAKVYEFKHGLPEGVNLLKANINDEYIHHHISNHCTIAM
ncbi:hypothetical protein [Neobacillus niacini]|uniref:hypothetical protein n=1 Tax=Neobacillus niacini TaxID=86668 RepID=UPI0005EE9C2E|nr:hypothetical protein [Neobacillus niacini]